VLITEDVRRRLDGSVKVREMAPAEVKGKPRPIVTFAVDGL
jgi:hypothetical protein